MHATGCTSPPDRRVWSLVTFASTRSLLGSFSGRGAEKITDEHSRVWFGSASALSVKLPGSGSIGPVVEDVDAYDVGARLAGCRCEA